MQARAQVHVELWKLAFGAQVPRARAAAVAAVAAVVCVYAFSYVYSFSYVAIHSYTYV